MVDYADLYKAGWADVPEPKLLPTGHWTIALNGMFFNEPKEEGKSARFSFRYVPIRPEGDVNEKQLKALGADYDFSINEIYNGGSDVFFWGSAKDKRKVIKHLAKHGVELPDDLPLLVQAEDGSPRVNPEVQRRLSGAKVTAELKVETYQGEDRNYAQGFVTV